MDSQVQPYPIDIKFELPDEFFIPDGYGIFKIKKTKLENMPIPARTLLYPSVTSTVGDLIKIFLEQYNIKTNEFGPGFKVRFGWQGVGTLPDNLQVFELKSKLNNMRIKVLEFTPFLTFEDVGSRGNFNNQCNPVQELNFRNHELYRYFQSKDNLIQVCVEFPQFYHVYYPEMIAGNTLQQEIAKLVKQKIN